MNHHQSLLEQVLDSSSSDEEDKFFCDVAHVVHNHYQSANAPKHGGSVVGHQVIDREREEGHWRLHPGLLHGRTYIRPNFLQTEVHICQIHLLMHMNFIFVHICLQ